MDELNRYSLDEINTVLLDIESELDLFERQADGVYYWERIRHPIHKKVINKMQRRHTASADSHNKNASPDHEDRLSLLEKIRILKKGFENIYKGNPFLTRDCDIIFNTGPVPRRKLKDGTEYHLQLDPIAEAVEDSYAFIEPKGGPSQAPSVNRRFLTLPRTTVRVCEKLGHSYDLPPEESDIIRILEREIETQVGVELDIVSMVENDLSSRKLLLPLYKKIIKRMGPEICFTTYAHSQYSTFIEACNRYNIPVVDIQHCAVNRNYWAYHYPGDRQRHVSADYFFAWGKYWQDSVELPFSDNEIYVTGYPYFNTQKSKYKNTTQENQILFLSNPNSGHSLSKFAAKFSKLVNDLKIVYKLHGAEFDSWKDDYPDLATAAESGNIVVVDEIEGSLHQLLAKSKVQVGVSTTALYEGMSVGLPTFILDAPRAYEMQGVIKRGYAMRLCDPEDMVSFLNDENNTCSKPQNEFFEKNSMHNISNSIDEIASIESIDIVGIKN